MTNDGLHPALLGRVLPKQSIDNMPAGPEIDLLIAKMMDYPIVDITPPCDHDTTPYMTHIAVISPTEIHYHRALGNEGRNYSWGIWNPSRDITRAWEVLEKLGGAFQLEKVRSATVEEEKSYHYEVYLHFRVGHLAFGMADTLPLAICRARLDIIGDG